MRTRHKKTHLSEAEINLTPLIDVCFVILIMFIVVAPMLEMERVELAVGPALNEQTTVAVQEKSPLIVHVYADNTIAVNKQTVEPSQLNTVFLHVKQKY